MFRDRPSPRPALRATAARRRGIVNLPVLTLLTVLGLAAGIPVATADATPSLSSLSSSPDQGNHAMGSTVRVHQLSSGTLPGSVTASTAPVGAPGMDVSSWQGTVDWGASAANGAKFAYVKATEGTGYTNNYFGSQYNGSYDAGLLRGAYHFARPDLSDGKTQANFFADNGGGWSPDGRTLPPLLDIEYDPYGSICYGLSQAAMSQWILDFANTMQARTGRPPAIYTTTDWWSQCTGNSSGSGSEPLFIANYSSSAGPMPASWSNYTLWQYADSGAFPGDQDVFNGSLDQLSRFAAGSAFTDVGPDNGFYSQISWMASTGLSTGYPDGTYRPLNSVNRDAMAAFLYRYAGSPAYTPPATSPFTDVATTDPFYKEICWLASTRIATGYPDGTFQPGQPVNRDAMAAFLYRFQGSPAYSPPATPQFTDVGLTDQFYKEISWLASTGISTGYPDGTYRPLDPVHRDAMAAFLYRFRITFHG
jgi:lysozyme